MILLSHLSTSLLAFMLSGSKPNEWPLEDAKVYLGIRKKFKPPTPVEFSPVHPSRGMKCHHPSGLPDHPLLVSFASQMGLHIDAGEDAPVSTSSQAPCPPAFPILHLSSCDPFPPGDPTLITPSYLSCTDEDEMWDWTTSILKAQVRGRRELRARSVGPALPSVPPMPTGASPLPSPAR